MVLLLNTTGSSLETKYCWNKVVNVGNSLFSLEISDPILMILLPKQNTDLYALKDGVKFGLSDSFNFIANIPYLPFSNLLAPEKSLACLSISLPFNGDSNLSKGSSIAVVPGL